MKYVFNKETKYYKFPMYDDKNCMFLYHMLSSVYPSMYTRKKQEIKGKTIYKYMINGNSDLISILKIILQMK